MSRAKDLSEWLPKRLAELVAEHGVPGAQAAVLVDGEVVDAAAGVLSLATTVETTTDSVFQIGSITKVWTATLVLQLVDDGLLDLDEPVVKYLPDFRLADAGAAVSITTRQLLDHTSGIEGDLFTDTGRGDDAVEKFVGTLAVAPQVHAPGEMFSYCNAGYVLLGRIVEVLRGKAFGAVLRERLGGPLELASYATTADEAIMFRAAVGHVDGPDGIAPAPVWCLAPSNAPAGSMLAMSARDLLKFAAAHIDGGAGVLSADSTAAMQVTQVEVPDIGLMGATWGLGWELFDFGVPVYGHDGGTIGQSAFLRVAPEAGVAVALLTNGGDVLRVYEGIVVELLRELAGAQIGELPAPPPQPGPIDAQLATGRYESVMFAYVLSVEDDGRAYVETQPASPEAKAFMAEPRRTEVVALREDALIGVEREMGRHPVYVLVGRDDQGRATHLFAGRAAKRS